MNQSCATMGYYREDGDFQVLMTLNNNDDILAADEFNSLVKLSAELLAFRTNRTITTLSLQSSPDYITTEPCEG